jgi:YVTN family beta-propeller protein
MKLKKSLLKTSSLLVMLLAATTAKAQSLSGDRVYTADQTSNTVSVIDPATQTLLGVIRLGNPCLGR